MNKPLLIFTTTMLCLMLIFVFTAKAAAVKVLFPVLLVFGFLYLVYLFFISNEGESNEVDDFKQND